MFPSNVLSTLPYLLSTPIGPLCNMYKDFSLPSVASSTCACTCLAIDLVRGPRRSSSTSRRSMGRLPSSHPRRSFLGARRSPSSRRFSWFGLWLPWLDVLGPPPSLWMGTGFTRPHGGCLMIPPVDQNARALPRQRYLPLDRLCTTLASVLHTSIHLKILQKTEWRRCGRSRSDAQVSDGTTKTLREKS